MLCFFEARGTKCKHCRMAYYEYSSVSYSQPKLKRRLVRNSLSMIFPLFNPPNACCITFRSCALKHLCLEIRLRIEADSRACAPVLLFTQNEG
jgi:hypothetical protein